VSPLTASLPMYALPGMDAANTALWDALREGLAAAGVRAAPAALSPPPMALPDSILPETLFSQMCGYPLRRHYDGQYRLLGTPLYDLPGCRLRPDGVPTHASFLVVARHSGVETVDALRGRRFAVNGFDSNSGMNLPRRLFAPLAEEGRFFSAVQVTGGHLRSMEAVAAGMADAAAIDCVTYGFCAIHRPDLVAALRILAETPSSPAIPFITAAATPAETAQRLTALLCGPLPSPRLRAALDGLAIRRVAPPRPQAYDAVLAYEAEAAAMGYAALR
jgi:ABC-type phosphate/phosphonate transport system substrate-binding protein